MSRYYEVTYRLDDGTERVVVCNANTTRSAENLHGRIALACAFRKDEGKEHENLTDAHRDRAKKAKALAVRYVGPKRPASTASTEEA